MSVFQIDALNLFSKGNRLSYTGTETRHR